MTLYLKYRPQTLDDLDQGSARELLKNTISGKSIPHAFLFIGPKGIGKTSAARILAKVFNCTNPKKNGEPCNKCKECVSISNGSNLDVIELDAASHRGIDDIRIIRDAVKLAPAGAAKKIYIVDEAHMLTTEASSALLKTLEEPPSHVVFILATTNPEKLLETIKSRTTVIVFKKATLEEILGRLKKVTKGEKIHVSDEVLKLIASAGAGSFRDSIKILEQLISDKNFQDLRAVEKFLFGSKDFDVDEFISFLHKKETKKALEAIERVVEKGGSIESTLGKILGRLREGLLSKAGILGNDIKEFKGDELIFLIELFSKAFQETPVALIEQLPTEVAILKWCEGSVTNNDVKVEKEPVQIIVDKQDQGKIKREFDSGVWKEILTNMRPVNASIEALLRASHPMSFDGNVLTLGVFYRFHKERLEQNVYRRVLEDVVSATIGGPVKVVCILSEPPKKEVLEETKKDETILTEGKDKDIIKIAEEIFNN